MNTIVVDDEALRGYNTDVDGVRDAAAWTLPASRSSGAAGLVLGAGGAARAAAARRSRAWACDAHDRQSHRRPARERLAGAPGRGRARRALSAAWPSTRSTAAEVPRRRLVVNATPLGMDGDA